MVSSRPVTSSAEDAFIARWKHVSGSERANYQIFVTELCALLGVPSPDPASDDSRDNAYVFERRVRFAHGDGTESNRFIDCYRRGAFVLEAKKVKKAAASKGFDDALLRARAQAENYARALPAPEGRPPFVVVVDVGHVIELYSEFSRSGSTYTPFPDPQSHRIKLSDLSDAAVRDRLRKVWLEPLELDPSRASARVTREIAARLAAVATSLEAAGRAPEHVAAFLSRCLFSMFAEDVRLLPKGSFHDLLQRHRGNPTTLREMIRALWVEMDRGGFSAALAEKVLRFNGKIFKNAEGDSYALPLDRKQIDELLVAAKANWSDVEPAIFGTLLERALDPIERHALGAHYTPRAYVERLVMPTVIEPLRAEWRDAQGAAVLLAREAEALTGKARDAKLREARDEVQRFHHRLCSIVVLDPACGSGNFLYVTLEHLKRLEGEVLNLLADLGSDRQGLQSKLEYEGETVTLQQLRGIELNQRAASIAELVLWIGYLQWQTRTLRRAVVEPVVKDYGNIEARDAVIAYDREEVDCDPATGEPRTQWDGRTYKPHSVTGEEVPDESARTLRYRYVNPRKADWPRADFIVGNPPFIGSKRMRSALGDGYVDAVQAAWPEIPEATDFVLRWWHHAALLVRSGSARRFGLITSNSLKQTYVRRAVEPHLQGEDRLSLVFAIPDHPWVDSTDGAAVRIAMTVAERGAKPGRLLEVEEERDGTPASDDLVAAMTDRVGMIGPDLRLGPNVAACVALKANLGICCVGMKTIGDAFQIDRSKADELGLETVPQLTKHIRPYMNGRDFTGAPRGIWIIDLFGLDEDEVRTGFPRVYQHLLTGAKPERDLNRNALFQRLWWVIGHPRVQFREATRGLDRYIVTVETAKHRVFGFLDSTIVPDSALVTIAISDAWALGVLSSQVHVEWALAGGGTLEDRPRYNKTRCFETFPFPDNDTGLTPPLRARIRDLAEQIDAHRRRQQSEHPDVTLTVVYNVLGRLRAGHDLTVKERRVHDRGLVSVLRSLHDELDEAVLAAYGWSDVGAVPWGDADARATWIVTVLDRLVRLNAARAAEEAAADRDAPGGRIRWLRPEFQSPADGGSVASMAEQSELELDDELPSTRKGAAESKKQRSVEPRRAWPAGLPDQMRAVSEVLSGSSTAMDEESLAGRFTGRGAWKQRLPQILETLEAVGRAHRVSRGWRAG
ncbi:MAG: class I SAM-dependent DNA methyltransferase [Planctomycetes bacterium]|nr:class I SAM-dependent DNA methyltransferase [Planctomycetota bacterium]